MRLQCGIAHFLRCRHPFSTVIIREKREIQYSETSVLELIGRGVLDRPVKGAMTE
jgi:hypothetical protein